MEKIGIIHGSMTDATERVAHAIQTLLGEERAEVKDVSAITLDDVNCYRNLILGVSTLGMEDARDDWDSKLELLQKADLKEKRIALFGLGNQDLYPDNYLDGMGRVYEALRSNGASTVGWWPSDGYSCNRSNALRENMFVGLALDEDTGSDETFDRIEGWLEQLDGQWL